MPPTPSPRKPGRPKAANPKRNLTLTLSSDVIDYLASRAGDVTASAYVSDMVEKQIRSKLTATEGPTNVGHVPTPALVRSEVTPRPKKAT